MSPVENALESPHVRPFDITGKPMKGWVMMSKEDFKAFHCPIYSINPSSKYAVALKFSAQKPDFKNNYE